ncbi:MAG: rhodanese-like domain-containing protein [Mucilaginibacter polytrichastri]|nr:rhodanese-like domain-containing protein [Mucilaginibacter polytrichastri]
MSSVSAQEFARLLQADPSLNILDVREDIEFHTFNIGGVHVPLGILPGETGSLPWTTDDEIYVVCRAGIRSETARRILKQAGFTRVINVNGGLTALNRIL